MVVAVATVVRRVGPVQPIADLAVSKAVLENGLLVKKKKDMERGAQRADLRLVRNRPAKMVW